jgi:hypothetical protein
VLTLAAEGVTQFRTGGSADNLAILRANDAVGYIQDEEWVTLGRNVRKPIGHRTPHSYAASTRSLGT